MQASEDLAVVSRQLSELRREFEGALGEARVLNDMAREHRVEVERLTDERELLGRAVEIFSNLAGRLEVTFIDSIEALVQQGLQSVFGAGITFSIERGVHGKQPTMAFKVSTPEAAEQELLDAHGGGMVALVGVILRIVVVRLLQHKQRQALFLDEPLAMLSAQYREPAAQLLRDLSHDLGMQIVLITHHSEFSEYADEVIRLEKRDGRAVVA